MDGYAAKGGWLCRERWMAMPRKVDGYAVKGGWLCRQVLPSYRSHNEIKLLSWLHST
ncbi:hypothetical protein ECTW00353_4934 [Escherichia coli TW00353]|nr:hypothetical protein ECTW00353_4934 [Escherichia coli TW00353]